MNEIIVPLRMLLPHWQNKNKNKTNGCGSNNENGEMGDGKEAKIKLDKMYNLINVKE
jgi:hypothetical protein